MTHVPSVSYIAMRLYESERRVGPRYDAWHKVRPDWHGLTVKQRDYYCALVKDLLDTGVVSRPIHA